MPARTPPLLQEMPARAAADRGRDAPRDGDPTVLAAALAHEIANALTPARSGLARGTPERESVERAVRACRTMLAIADDALHVEHEADGWCDAMAAWRGIRVEVGGRLRNGTALEVRVGRSTGAAVPCGVVERLLANLVANAGRAAAEVAGRTSDGSTPRVRLEIRGHVADAALDEPGAIWIHRSTPKPDAGLPWLMIEVSDNGPGFSLGSERAAFRPGWSASSAESPGRHGLGLAICHALVSRWSGCLGVVRASGLGPDGAGARVVVALPAHAVTHTHSNHESAVL